MSTDIKQYEDLNISLMKEHNEILQKWIEDGMELNETANKLKEIRERMDHIIYGINYIMLMDQLNLRNSGIQLV